MIFNRIVAIIGCALIIALFSVPAFAKLGDRWPDFLARAAVESAKEKVTVVAALLTHEQTIAFMAATPAAEQEVVEGIKDEMLKADAVGIMLHPAGIAIVFYYDKDGVEIGSSVGPLPNAIGKLTNAKIDAGIFKTVAPGQGV
jgi:hypothetical protein